VKQNKKKETQKSGDMKYRVRRHHISNEGGCYRRNEKKKKKNRIIFSIPPGGDQLVVRSGRVGPSSTVT
jgi:hypothetical protein